MTIDLGEQFSWRGQTSGIQGIVHTAVGHELLTDPLRPVIGDRRFLDDGGTHILMQKAPSLGNDVPFEQLAAPDVQVIDDDHARYARRRAKRR